MEGIIRKYLQLSLPIKAAVWFTISSFLLKGISFISAPIFARLLSVEEYGKLSLFTSYEQILLIIGTWEIALGPYQKGLFKFKSAVNELTTSSVLFSNVITVTLGIIVLFFINPIGRFTEMPIAVIPIVFIYMLVQPAYQCWITWNRVHYNYRNVVLMTLILTIFQVVVPIVALMIWRRTAAVKLIFSMIPAIVIFFIFYIKEIKFPHNKKQICILKNHWSFLFHFSAPLVLHSLSYLVLAQADRIMIGKMVGNVEAGIYSVAYTIASIVLIIQSSVNQVITPWIYGKLEERDYQSIKNRLNKLLVVVGVLFILFILVAPEFITLLYPKEYHEGIWFIPPISVGAYFMFMYSIFVNFETYFETTKYIAYVSTVCAVVNIILNYVGIKAVGYIACAYTTLFCYILFAFGHYIFMQKVLKRNKINFEIFDRSTIVLSTVIMLGAMTGITFIYHSIYLRYIVAVIFVVLLAINRKSVISVLKK